MELLSRLTDSVGQGRFHKRVDILRAVIDCQRPRSKIVLNALESGDNAFRILLRDNPLFAEHCGMCYGAMDVIERHPLIYVD